MIPLHGPTARRRWSLQHSTGVYRRERLRVRGPWSAPPASRHSTSSSRCSGCRCRSRSLPTCSSTRTGGFDQPDGLWLGIPFQFSIARHRTADPGGSAYRVADRGVEEPSDEPRRRDAHDSACRTGGTPVTVRVRQRPRSSTSSRVLPAPSAGGRQPPDAVDRPCRLSTAVGIRCCCTSAFLRLPRAFVLLSVISLVFASPAPHPAGGVQDHAKELLTTAKKPDLGDRRRLRRRGSGADSEHQRASSRRFRLAADHRRCPTTR